ncbi:methyltransferase, FkbM family protein [Pseudomonas aeruginosa]|nr:methyltransferase, FkbM family protein [Pseudomonas aeruginosa]
MSRDQALARFEAQLMGWTGGASGGGLHPEMLGQARCAYLLGPTSFLGLSFAESIARRLGEAGIDVAYVDDGLASRQQAFGEHRVLDTRGFIDEARRRPGALAVNLGTRCLPPASSRKLADGQERRSWTSSRCWTSSACQ